MMRADEIKFKGIRVDNGGWIYGDLVHYFFIKMGKRTDHVSIGVDLDFYDVIPETVCLFSGFKDRYGIEAYRGDIIRFCDDPPYCSDYIIKYDEERLIWIADGVGDYMEDLWELECEFVRVIGNIYDNPELLKDK